ncbi:MAG: hypothetical protein ABW184_09575 [Sphingobium sp.]
MNRFDDHDEKEGVETLRTSLLMLAFGLAMLAFLIGIDRQQWFELRPASGTATAMSKAVDIKARTVEAKP